MNLYNLSLEDVKNLASDVDNNYSKALEMASMTDSRELYDFVNQYSRYTAHTKHALESIEVAQGMLDVLNTSRELPASNARVIMTCVEGLRVGLGHTRGSKRSMSAESIRTDHDGKVSLRLAKEGIITFIGDVIKAIIDAIVSVGKAIANFIGRLFGRDSSNSSRIKQVEIKIDKVKLREKMNKNHDQAVKDAFKRASDNARRNSKGSQDRPDGVTDEILKDLKDNLDGLSKRMKEDIEEHERKDALRDRNKEMNRLKEASKVPKEELMRRAREIVGAKVMKVTQFGVKPEQVKHLSKNGVSYKNGEELLGWLKELEDLVIVPYEAFVNHSHLDAIIDNVAKVFEKIEDVQARGQSIIDLVDHTTTPHRKYMKTTTSTDGTQVCKVENVMGSYDMVLTTPDPKSGAHLVEKHLGSSMFELIGRDFEAKFSQQPLSNLDFEVAEKILRVVKNIQASLAVEKIKDLEKMTSEFEKVAERLKSNFKGEESEIQHLGKLAHKVVNFYTNVVFKYVFEIQKYSTRVINELVLMASMSAEWDWAIYQTSDELEELIKSTSGQ